MAIIDVKCVSPSCGHHAEVYRHASDWPKTPACETCGRDTVQIHLSKAVQWTVEPVVVFKAPDGTFRFPGDAHGVSAAHYAKLGYDRVEIRGATEMRRFESTMSKSQRSEMERRVEAKQALEEKRQSESRSELRRRMQGFSEFGKAVARVAMKRNDEKPKPKVHDPGFMSEVYNYDRSNREQAYDERGRRRRD